MRNFINKKDNFRKTYIMPQEFRVGYAKSNASILLKFLIGLLSFGIFSTVLFVFIYRNDLNNHIPSIIYHGTFIAISLIGLLLSKFVLKHERLPTELMLSPLHFIYLSCLALAMYNFYNDSTVFNSFVTFVCVVTITPILFTIEPLFFISPLLICSILMWKKTAETYTILASVNIFTFAIIASALNINRWRITIKEYIHEHELSLYKEKMEKEINLASTVQQSFFKYEDTVFDEWSIVYYSKAMTGISGDLLDIFNEHSKLNGIGIFDVSGHGISSGLITMLIKNIIDQEFADGINDNLKTVVDRINVHYQKEKGNIENYLTGILCRINGNKVDFVNAGHSMPILYSAADNKTAFVQSDSKELAYGAIGLTGIPYNFISHSIEMASGDELVLFTDGATDALNIENKPYGKERFINSINRNSERPLTTQINCIVSDISNYSHDMPQQDDISIIILKKK